MSQKVGLNFKRETVKVHKTKRDWNILKEVFVDFSQRTDVNAYGKIFKYENKLVKLLWLFILIVSLGFTALFMRDNMSIFLDYEVVSQIGVVYETITEFPAVTFCDNSPFTDGTNHPPRHDQAQTDPHNLKYLYLMSASAPPPYYDDDKRKKLGFSMWHLTNNWWPYCHFNDKNCTNDLDWYWSYEYGNCFQFNTGRNINNLPIDIKKSTIAGPDDGLEISVVPLANYNSYEFQDAASGKDFD